LDLTNTFTILKGSRDELIKGREVEERSFPSSQRKRWEEIKNAHNSEAKKGGRSEVCIVQNGLFEKEDLNSLFPERSQEGISRKQQTLREKKKDSGEEKF